MQFAFNKDQRVLQVLSLSGLRAPVVLERASELLEPIQTALALWPFTVGHAPPDTPPCMAITGLGGGRYRCQTTDGAAPKEWNSLNAVVELIAELAWEQIRSNPARLCLHCAAVDFNGRLVLFPNRRRAGKSLLIAVLAQRGYRVFTDDFLPVDVAEDGEISGVANGILPRIRFPLPDDLSDTMSNWIAADPGARNKQYKYLAADAVAPRASRLTIGAVVVLDRSEDATPELMANDPASVLDEMIMQNFARSSHAANILKTASGLADTAALFRLSYASAEQAADLLESAFAQWTGPPPRITGWCDDAPGDAELDKLIAPTEQLDPFSEYIQCANATVKHVDGETYLADGHGLSVFRLNDGSSAIWQLLAEPMTQADLCDLLSIAFPDAAAEAIERDTAMTLAEFVRNRLIVLADAKRQAAV